MVATELLQLAMEMDEERKARLKKMVATTQLRLTPETEDERRARLEYLSDNPIYIPNNLYHGCCGNSHGIKVYTPLKLPPDMIYSLRSLSYGIKYLYHGNIGIIVR